MNCLFNYLCFSLFDEVDHTRVIIFVFVNGPPQEFKDIDYFVFIFLVTYTPFYHEENETLEEGVRALNVIVPDNLEELIVELRVNERVHTSFGHLKKVKR